MKEGKKEKCPVCKTELKPLKGICPPEIEYSKQNDTLNCSTVLKFFECKNGHGIAIRIVTGFFGVRKKVELIEQNRTDLLFDVKNGVFKDANRN